MLEYPSFQFSNCICLAYKIIQVNISDKGRTMSKKSFVEFADVFFVSDDDSLDLSNSVPMTTSLGSMSAGTIGYQLIDAFEQLETNDTENPLATNWSLIDRKLQLAHLESTIKHLRSDILKEYEIFGLTTNACTKVIKILELTNEWIPICADDLNCVNFAVYLVESNAYAQSLINPSLTLEELLISTNVNQELAELWKSLQADRDHIALLLKTESEHSLEQKEQIKALVENLDKRCDNNLSIFSANEKLCELIKNLKGENLAFFSRLKDF